MPENTLFPPEGLHFSDVYSLSDLHAAKENRTILEAIPQRCSTNHTLHFSLGTIHAKMPRKETVAPWISGADRDISILSRVGKHTCFTVEAIFADAKGAPEVLLSRRNAQERPAQYGQGNAHASPGTPTSPHKPDTRAVRPAPPASTTPRDKRGEQRLDSTAIRDASQQKKKAPETGAGDQTGTRAKRGAPR